MSSSTAFGWADNVSPKLHAEATEVGLVLRTLLVADDRARIDIIKNPGSKNAVLVGIASRWTRDSKWSSIYLLSNIPQPNFVCRESDAEAAIRAVLGAYAHDVVSDNGLEKS